MAFDKSHKIMEFCRERHAVSRAAHSREIEVPDGVAVEVKLRNARTAYKHSCACGDLLLSLPNLYPFSVCEEARR